MVRVMLDQLRDSPSPLAMFVRMERASMADRTTRSAVKALRNIVQESSSTFSAPRRSRKRLEVAADVQSFAAELALDSGLEMNSILEEALTQYVAASEE